MSPNHSPPAPANILVVDDDLGTIQALGKALHGLGEVRFATRGAEALRLAREAPPDLILLDCEMPGMSGYEVCTELKADPMLLHVPVIFVTSHAGHEVEAAGFDAGAADFIAKPIHPVIVNARARTHIALKQSSDRLRALCTTDGLTGLANRRAFDMALESQWRCMLRSAEPLSLLMVDVDHFKRFNDHCGHPAGDACLIQVARTLQDQLRRPSDVAARYGGEEFALLLPSTDRHGAAAVAQHVLAAMQELAIAHADSDCAAHVTVSVGISSCDRESPSWTAGPGVNRSDRTDATTPIDLVAAADGALYAAKRAGRARAEAAAIESAVQRRLSAPPTR